MSAYTEDPSKGSLIQFHQGRRTFHETPDSETTRARNTLSELIQCFEQLRAAEADAQDARGALETRLNQERAKLAQFERQARDREAELVARLEARERELAAVTSSLHAVTREAAARRSRLEKERDHAKHELARRVNAFRQAWGKLDARFRALRAAFEQERKNRDEALKYGEELKKRIESLQSDYAESLVGSRARNQELEALKGRDRQWHSAYRNLSARYIELRRRMSSFAQEVQRLKGGLAAERANRERDRAVVARREKALQQAHGEKLRDALSQLEASREIVVRAAMETDRESAEKERALGEIAALKAELDLVRERLNAVPNEPLVPEPPAPPKLAIPPRPPIFRGSGNA